MTPHHHNHAHGHPHGHSHSDIDPWTQLPEGFIERLDLESRLSAPIQDAAISGLSSALESSAATVVDLGSGSGAGTVALAAAFPKARVHAVDLSELLLEKVDAAAAHADVADRVQLHCTDLSKGWPSDLPRGVDAIWASLSLHHVQNSGEVVRQIHDALRPGGVFILTETPGDARFEPEGLNTSRAGLGNRVLDLVRHGADFDTDWDSALAEAGFSATKQELEFVASARSSDGAKYLLNQLRSHQEQLRESGAAEDTEALNLAIDEIQAGNSDIAYRAGRTVWVARRRGAEIDTNNRETKKMDVAVIGGGAAGLAASIALGRSRRNIVVIDDGHPRNAPADAAHNVLGNEGISPLELLEKGRAEAKSYGVNFIKGRVAQIDGEIDGFTLSLEGTGQQVQARRIIIATGLVDELPDIPGVQEGWGATVLHCPFCHGWEVKDQKIAVLASGELAAHQAVLFRQLSEDVTVFLNDVAEPAAEVLEQLDALSISLVRGAVEKLVMDGNQVQGVKIENSEVFDADAVVVAPKFNARTELFDSLGGAAEETPFAGRFRLTHREELLLTESERLEMLPKLWRWWFPRPLLVSQLVLQSTVILPLLILTRQCFLDRRNSSPPHLLCSVHSYINDGA
ncbi:FAD-dependent oxidoreductase [Corynebacterium sp. L4756]